MPPEGQVAGHVQPVERTAVIAAAPLEGSTPATGKAAHAFRRRVLFLVAGLTPQIVTETLYALTQCMAQPFIPTEIHLLTTSEGSRRARLMLLEGEQGRFHRFCADYHLPQLAQAFDESRIHLVCGADGRALDDIVTAADNAAVADAIMQHIRVFTADPDCAVHASVAGGRKTMSVALALAMSLFGRRQDTLSHVLVSPPFESHPEFFYPPPRPRVLLVGMPGQQRPVSTEEAEVSLAEIPFLRLRGRIDPALLGDAASWSEVVRRAQQNLEAPVLRIHLPAGEVQVGEPPLAVPMPPAARAFLLMLARRALRGEMAACPPDGAPDAALAREYLAALDALDIPGERTQRTRDALHDGMDKNFFERRKTEVNKALRKALGPGPAEAYLIRRIARGGRRYEHGLQLPPESIEIVE